MRACFALTIAAAVLAAASASPQTSSDVVALQRAVFGAGSPAMPETPERMEAQLRLAKAYAGGAGIDQDVELGCGLAQVVTIQSLNLGERHPLHLRAATVAGQICANARDLAGSLTRASCPHFGVEGQTFEYGSGAWLTTTRDGWTVEDANGVREGDWAVNCFDVVASVRLVRVDPPAVSGRLPRQFIELFVWHQSYLHDGTTGPRSLEWHVNELRPEYRDVIRLERLRIAEEKGAFIWPTPPVPDSIAVGARFRTSLTGTINWSFDKAPELGRGTIAPAGR